MIPSRISVLDIFGRDVKENGLVLVDWDGYMANPAISFNLKAPVDAVLPVTAELRVDHPIIYFDLPCQVNAQGASKTISFTARDQAVPVLISNAPTRGTAARYSLSICMTDAVGRKMRADCPIQVVTSLRKPENAVRRGRIFVDFSQDHSGLFADPVKRKVAQRAADDWFYYIADMGLDATAAGSEPTWIWDQNAWHGGSLTTNKEPYSGFTLYAYGIHCQEIRSGGEGSQQGGWQSTAGKRLPLRRSGGLEIETAGNFNTRGWTLTTDNDTWWQHTGQSAGELFSIAHHEIGHAIAFNNAYPQFQQYFRKGFIDEPRLVSYYGRAVPIDKHDHFDGVIDPESGKGAFGYDWYGLMPAHRWMITKLDLLALQAVGYRLAPSAAFLPLTFPFQPLPAARLGKPYKATLVAGGGIPFYNWVVSKGSLPEGLSLNPFTGVISGNPGQCGTFRLTVRVQDYHKNAAGIEQSFVLAVAAH